MNHLSEIQLNEYLDQMLDEQSRQNVETHLAKCEACRAALDELQNLFATLDKLPDIPLTRDLTPGVLARLPQKSGIPSLWRQPAFLMQTLLTIILMISSFSIIETLLERIPDFENALVLPHITFPTWAEISAEFSTLLAWSFEFTLPTLTFEMPTMPSLPALPISPDSGIMLGLVAVATIMWVVGNVSLLRSKPKVRG